MTGDELIKRLRKLARARGITVVLDTKPGKGSHGRLYFGERFTTVKDRRKPIGEGLLRKMLADLGLSKEDIR